MTAPFAAWQPTLLQLLVALEDRGAPRTSDLLDCWLVILAHTGHAPGCGATALAGGNSRFCAGFDPAFDALVATGVICYDGTNYRVAPAERAELPDLPASLAAVVDQLPAFCPERLRRYAILANAELLLAGGLEAALDRPGLTAAITNPIWQALRRNLAALHASQSPKEP